MNARIKISLFIFSLLGCGTVGATPQNIWEAKAGFAARQKNVIQWWLNDSITNLTVWDSTPQSRRNLRKIAAGLAALKLGDTTLSNYPPSSYPTLAKTWLWNNIHKFTRVGTEIGGQGDYDMLLTQMVILMYSFKDDASLLTDTAVRALACQNAQSDYRHCMDSGFCEPSWQAACEVSCPLFCPPICEQCLAACNNPNSICPIPYTGQSLAETKLNVIDFGHFYADIPETENHVLMIYAWKYLINQWIRKNYRNLNLVPYDSAIHNNEGKDVEKLLLEAMSRIVRQGFFETNARPYESLSLLPLMALYGFADTTTAGGRKIRLAAQNALDYAALKFAFQSLEGKRYGPSRRNIANKSRPGIYDNDYLAQIFGILSGAYVANDESTCTQGCLYDSAGDQRAGFALWVSLLSYRVPDPILDFMLRKDNHRPGYGAWVRMQARFSQEHYKFNRAAAYKPGGVLNSPDLSSDSLILAPEFYFLTQDYLNSAGGGYSHYAGFDTISFFPPWVYTDRVYERFTKSTAMIPSGNSGFWASISQAQDSIMMMKGDAYDSGGTFTSEPWFPAKSWWTSKNYALYKNVAYGYSGTVYNIPLDTNNVQPPYWLQSNSIWPMSFPKAWTGVTVPLLVLSVPGNDTLVAARIFPLTSSNFFDNPVLGCYVLALSVKAWPDLDGYWGIWEVIPEARFPGVLGINNLISWLDSTMQSLGGFPGYPVWLDTAASVYPDSIIGGVDYITATTGEKLSFTLGYGASPFAQQEVLFFGTQSPFRGINDSLQAARTRYGNPEAPGSFPLIEAKQVDENFGLTGVSYISWNDSGKILVNNPHLEWELELDATDWYNPARGEEVNAYYIHAAADTTSPAEFATWDEAYETVKEKMSGLTSYDKTVKFYYVSPEKEPVHPASSAVYEQFPLSGSGSVPFTLEGREDFP